MGEGLHSFGERASLKSHWLTEPHTLGLTAFPRPHIPPSHGYSGGTSSIGVLENSWEQQGLET